MGGIYEVCHLDGLRCHDTHTRFNKDWFRHSKVDGEGGFIDTHRQHDNLISILQFFQNKESRLKMATTQMKQF
jgi:hypothetical protein